MRSAPIARRALILSTETDKAEQNRVSKEIPKRKKAGEDVAPIFARMTAIVNEAGEVESCINAAKMQLRAWGMPTDPAATLARIDAKDASRSGA